MKIGFLPLYIELYDSITRSYRDRMEPFYEKMAVMLEGKGLEVVRAPFCRLKNEFEDAVASFEAAGCDAIVTLHIAYSPSLEAIDALTATRLPIIVMDTTETLVFGNMQDPGEVMYNHGIHGVMDLCSMLTRRGKPYAIAAGHCTESDVTDRVAGFVKAAVAAASLSGTKVGAFGGEFEGMGDFKVCPCELKERFGVTVENVDADRMRAIYGALTDEEVKAELAENEEAFERGANVIDEEYELCVRSCLTLRKYLAEKEMGAFTVNFKHLGWDTDGLTSMPFIEACKGMARGLGYAGEGDPMTAAFTGAFLQGWPDSSFVEMFCPDWVHGFIFMQHMGEVNYRMSAKKPELTRTGKNYTAGANPYVGYTRFKGGKGVYVNVSRGPDDFRLNLLDAEMLDYDDDAFRGNMRGWLKPVGKTTAETLEALGRAGATHHSTFVMGATMEQMEFFGRLLGMTVVVL